MKIDTLLEDLDNLLTNGYEVSNEEAEAFGNSMANLLKTRLKREAKGGTLRMSNLGKPNRQLWYEVNVPHESEPLQPSTYLKFLYGDVIEELLLTLVKLTGHRVEGQQDAMELHGIKGSRDVVIDGMTVDVKSASEYSFSKFKEGLKPEKDTFGYLQQIQNYIHAAKDDPLVTEKDLGAFLVLNKVSGDILLDYHKKNEIPIDEIIQYKKDMVANPEPPERCFEPEPKGQSGNMVLNSNCSFCSYKRLCWPELRTFLYAGAQGKKIPTFFTTVVEEPKVFEVK